MLAWGGSRGSEAALLLGVHYPGLISGVIATSPSDHANGGLPDVTLPAWTLHGAPVPFAGPADFNAPGAPGTPAAVIPVERIAGPVFTVCGAEDLIWASCPFAAAIARRRGDQGTRFGDVHLTYPHAGHFVASLAPYDSSTALDGRTATGRLLESGGTIVDNAEDQAPPAPDYSPSSPHFAEPGETAHPTICAACVDGRTGWEFPRAINNADQIGSPGSHQ